jgi:hypothetical protein
MEGMGRVNRAGVRFTAVTLLAAVSGLAGFSPAGATTPAPAPTIYSVTKGCYSLVPASTGKVVPLASKQRFQATKLGSYLLYGKAKDFLSASGNSVGRAAEPSPSGDWRLTDLGGGRFSLSPASSPGSVLRASGNGLQLVTEGNGGSASKFTFKPASGCAVFPEAQLGVKGKPAKGKTFYGEVQGLLDGHMHWMTYEYLGGNFHCGEPWDKYGITKALPDCAGIEGPQGTAAPFQNFLNYGNPAQPHDTKGYPTLAEWKPTNLTYEGTYYRWVQRAWKAGLREIVMPVNENRILCTLMTNRRNPCDEMNTVFKGIADIKRMQRYVDAQAGGPGKGFFQIVKTPMQARKVMNKGKMAVVLEVEVSELFNCSGADPSSCSKQKINDGINDLYKRGVRSSLLLNKFDNPLTGVRFDSGPIGVLINAANKVSYGSFWDAQTCTGDKHDNEILNPTPQQLGFFAAILSQLGVGGTAPVYPPGPHCNTRGLTGLGKYTVNRMMDKHMIVNPDHMSQMAVSDTLDIAEKRKYSGIISPHGWMDPRNWPRIYQLGGMAFPGAGSASSFVDAWKAYRPKKTPYYFGWGYGADLGGLAEQGEPAAPGSPNAVKYPFKSLDGKMTISREKTGQRTFDYSQDGVAQYGMYADWAKEVSNTGGKKLTRDMLRGPEAYLQMWERATGVPASRCQSASTAFTHRGLGKIRFAQKQRTLLRAAGQPIRRTRAWTYCVKGKRGKGAGQTAVLTPSGAIGVIASSAKGQGLLGISAGSSKRAAERVANPIGHGLLSVKARGKTAIFRLRHSKVETVALASNRVAKAPAKVAAYMRFVPRHGTKARPAAVLGKKANKLSPENAVPLVKKSGASPFAMFCGL